MNNKSALLLKFTLRLSSSVLILTVFAMSALELFANILGLKNWQTLVFKSNQNLVELSAQIYKGAARLVNRLTLTSGIVILGLVILSLLILAAAWLFIWKREKTVAFEHNLIKKRQGLHSLRWLFASLILIIPWVMLQYTPLGNLLGFFQRLTLLALTAGMVGVLLTSSTDKLVKTSTLIVALLLAASLFTFGGAISGVTSYPFSLHWSEGNRIWDYSALFGRRLYDYPADQPIYAYIDLGRQSLWGLPFLLPKVSIFGIRLWSALLFTIPYAIFGWVVFRRNKKHTPIWLLSGLWSMIFINMGPIYTPLVLVAILVAIAWRNPLWLALPLVTLAGYYAQLSRFTWIFAPAMWAGMLFLADFEIKESRLPIRRWGLAIFGVAAGIMGGYLIPRLPQLGDKIASISRADPISETVISSQPDLLSVEGLQTVITRQPLIWERLLPNPTFGQGILLALLLATGPLIVLLLYLAHTRQWKLDLWGRLILLGTSTAFFTVGLIISVKIGGGSNLHNMDMFLITLLFMAALAWRQAGYRFTTQIDHQAGWLQVVWIFMLFVFTMQPLMKLSPLELPSKEVTQTALNHIRNEVRRASQQGEVLFLDQRQLLTFGYIEDVPLVVEYEKKLMMDKALGGEADYFQPLYDDLAHKRFAIIISEPLKTRTFGNTRSFGEENDAWVQWVSEPLLCFYEPRITIQEVRIQLLYPRSESINCSLDREQ